MCYKLAQVNGYHYVVDVDIKGFFDHAELINCGLERFVGDRFTRASFGKPRFDVRLPLMDQF